MTREQLIDRLTETVRAWEQLTLDEHGRETRDDILEDVDAILTEANAPRTPTQRLTFDVKAHIAVRAELLEESPQTAFESALETIRTNLSDALIDVELAHGVAVRSVSVEDDIVLMDHNHRYIDQAVDAVDFNDPEFLQSEDWA